MNPSNPLILVDGSQYLFRAYHGSPDMHSSLGFPTHAIRGVVSMLRKLVIENPDATIVVIFDAPGKTFRDDLYSEYKANRPPMEDDLRIQIDATHEFVRAMGLPLLIIPEVEADDVMGTLATQASKIGRQTTISTSDKDMAQLVGDHVSLSNSMKNETLDREGVIDKFGVAPELIIDYLALMGDKIDNIPGIPGVGPKTAAKWLNEHGSLEKVIANAESVKGKVGENLRANLGLLPLSRELATIKCDVEMDYTMDNLAHKSTDMETIRELCTKYQLRHLLDQFEDREGAPSPIESTVAESHKQVDFIDSVSDLTEIVQRLQAEEQYTIYVVTETENPIRPQVFGIALSPSRTSDQVWIIRLNPSDSLVSESVPLSTSLELLKPLFENADQALITYDVKSVRHMLLAHNIQLNNEVQDVMLASYVLNSVAYGHHSLRGIAGTLLDQTILDDRDLLGSGAKRLTFVDVDDTQFGNYVVQQIATIQEANSVLQSKLNESPTLYSIYQDIEIPLEPYLCGMEHHGTLIDPGDLEDLQDELETRKSHLEKEAYESAGRTFNIGSPKQLQVVLFDELGLTAPSASKSGNRSTSEDVLSKITHEHPLPQIVLDYRATTKLISTYVVALRALADPDTHRIHTTYSQANASTGRLASINPNLQNIPIRTAEGRRVREAFIAPEEKLLLTADYSQIELRVMAHLTDDPGLTSAFQSGVDIHQATASEVFGMALDQVDEDQRRSAKAINFGLMYGMSAFGLARTLEIPQREAKIYIEAYFQRYPNVQEYVEKTKENARTHGYVETILGRRIHLRDIHARNPMQRQAAERLAINAPVQGSAADIIKKATIRVGEWLNTSDLDISMILQVHDELVFEVREDQVGQAQTHISEIMRTAVPLKVPVEVDVGVASNWSAAH